MEIPASYQCAYCGEEVETVVDPSGFESRRALSYVEDCAVCCRPNVLRVWLEEDGASVTIEAEFEG